MRRRLIPILAAILLVILAGGYTAYWFRLKQIVGEDIEFWVAVQRAQGFSVTINEHPAIGGFPLAVTADLGQPDITAPGGLWHWQGPQTQLLIRPWSPFTLNFLAPGHHHLVIAGAAPRDIALDATNLVFGEKITSDNIVTDVSLAVSDAIYADNVSGQAKLASVAIAGHLPRPAKPDADTSILDLTADAAAIDLPADIRPVLGQRIGKIHIVAQFMGAIPDALPREALAGWRDGSGIIQLREGEMDWGPLAAAGDGTIALDQDMQPLAAGTLRVAGLPETLDLLSNAGLIAGGPATMAKLMFGAVAQTPAGGGRPEVKLPVTIQNSYVYIGPIKLAPLKPIDWSQVP